jgi:hypothetical protein
MGTGLRGHVARITGTANPRNRLFEGHRGRGSFDGLGLEGSMILKLILKQLEV